jgi:hypothetical protein
MSFTWESANVPFSDDAELIESPSVAVTPEMRAFMGGWRQGGPVCGLPGSGDHEFLFSRTLLLSR